jgi:hypothetical protein
MELGRPGATWLAFQLDYRPVHVGIYFWCLGVIVQETSAARATFLIIDNDDRPEAIANIRALARQNPARLAVKMRDQLEDAGPEAVAWCAAWCEDLILLGQQIAVEKQLQWLRPLAAKWGNEAAGEALRAANKSGEAFRADRLAAFPAIFGKVTRREALVVWQADMLARSRHRPRPHEETFAASRYREITGDGITHLEVVEKPGEVAGLPVRVCDVAKCMTLNSWMIQQQEAVADHETSLTPTMKCNILANILGALVGTQLARSTV